jgi:CBS domain-containing protein
VSDVMSELICIDGDLPVVAAAKKMIDKEISSIIVTQKGVPKGIITKTDLITRVIVTKQDPNTLPSKKIMSSPLISIGKNTMLLDAMRYVRDHDIHQVLIDEDGDLVGIVSEGDLIRAVTLSSLTQFSTILRKKNNQF